MLTRDILFRALEYFREKIDKDLPMQHVSILLAVAASPRITMQELSRILGMPQGSVSRNVKILSKYNRKPTEAEKAKGQKGPIEAGRGLLHADPDLTQRKHLAVSLTTKGFDLIRGLDRILSGEPLGELDTKPAESD